MRLLSTGLLAFLATTAAAASAATDAACDEIAAAIDDRVHTEWAKDYRSEVKSYWSTRLRDAKPACVVLPQSAEEVSAVVKILNKYPDVEFAVKSGGHTPAPRHSSVSGGVLISTRDMNGATYDEETGTAYVKPGGEWNDVISQLEEESGVAVVGGRLGIVGVAGLILQGGLSFLSAQRGLAADTVVSWDMVLADGTIKTIKASEEPELAVALRGSGSQFGICTGYTMKAWKMGKVWGGSRIYSADKEEDIHAALHNFVPGNEEDPKAAVIVTDLNILGDVRNFLIFYFYEGEEPPTTGPFAQFLNIKHTIDSTKTRGYADLLKSNGALPDLLESRNIFRTATLPYLKDVPHMYKEISDKFHSILSKLIDKHPLRLSAQYSVDFQPFPAVIGKHSQEAGGNSMGLGGENDIDRIVLEIQCSWKSPKDDVVFDAAGLELLKWLETKIPEWTQGADAGYLPLFMNDAAADQNVTGTYKEYSKLKSLQQKMDPDAFWKKRGGGFTY